MSFEREQEIARGRDAAALLENELLLDACRETRERLVETCLDGDTVEEREDARAKVRGIEELMCTLRSIRDNGETTRKLLER